MAQLEIRIAKPCHQSWTAMKGDERVRFCGSCKKNVFNISEMTEAEVEELIRKTEGNFCARIYRRKDSRVMTKDCPKGVAAYRRKRVLVLATAGAAMVYAFSLRAAPAAIPAREVAVGALPVVPKPKPEEFSMGAPSIAVGDTSMVRLGEMRVIPKSHTP